jgi:KDO2-lipid IV(A) lauroyltransferase
MKINEILDIYSYKILDTDFENMTPETIRTILKQRINNPSKHDIETFSYKFALFKANIKKFLPNIKIDNCDNLFRKYTYNTSNALLDQNDFQKLDQIKIHNNSSFNFNSKLENPTIFATFHYGSYRMIISCLIKAEFNVVLIVTPDVYKTQKIEIEESIKKYKILATQNSSDFIILSIANTSSIFELKRLLQRGYVSVVYLDGNSGIDKNVNFEKNFINLNFLNDSIFVKNGIIILASIINATIIPAIAQWDENENVIINIYKERILSDYQDKKLFVSQSLIYLYSLLEKHIKENPEQWECWTYMHKWFYRENVVPYIKIKKDQLQWKFNKERFSPFKMLNEFYLFDILSYRIFPVSQNIYSTLENETFQSINNKELDILLLKNIII